MTPEDRVKAVSDFGFTERQARFMVTVMLNGGVCVPRQYARSVGTAYGQNVNAFFDKLVGNGFAVRCECVHNRARVYQVRYQPLYRSIGEPNSPNRKPIAAGNVMERLMLLDAVISHPDLVWLSTASDKVAFFAAASSCPSEQLPYKSVFAPFPIGVDTSGRPVFIFVASTWNSDDFRAFLQRHADILSSLRGWTVLLVLPPHVAMVKASFEAAVRDELASPLSPRSFEELRWYFEQRRRLTPGENDEADRFRRLARAFAGTRWRLLYRRWLTDGDSVLNVATSAAFRDALMRGDGVIKSEVLAHSYRHLSPLASLVRARVRGLRRGNGHWEGLNPCRQKGRRPLPPIDRGSELRS